MIQVVKGTTFLFSLTLRDDTGAQAAPVSGPTSVLLIDDQGNIIGLEDVGGSFSPSYFDVPGMCRLVLPTTDNAMSVGSSWSVFFGEFVLPDGNQIDGLLANFCIVAEPAPASTAVSSTDLTPTRAAKLDNLDATVSSRAPAATAVANTDLTPARAAALDHLDADVSDLATADAAAAIAAKTNLIPDGGPLAASNYTPPPTAEENAAATWANAQRTLTSDPVLIAPVQTEISEATIAASVGGTIQPLSAYQQTRLQAAFRVADGDGDPVDLTGHDLRFVLHDAEGEVLVQIDGPGEQIALSASDDAPEGTLDTATVTTTQADLDLDPEAYQYELRDLTLGVVLAAGQFAIKLAPPGAGT